MQSGDCSAEKLSQRISENVTALSVVKVGRLRIPKVSRLGGLSRGSAFDGMAEEGLAMALDWSRCAAVESVPGKVSGAWVFRGTRIPASAVFENLEDGHTIDEIVQMFDGLTREQVKAVLDFAAHSLEASAPAP